MWSGAPESSVYRNMRELQDAGVIDSVWGTDPIERFELAPWVLGADHHHHLVCTACGFIIDYVAPEQLECLIDLVVPAIARAAAFVVRRHTLDLVGLCNGCTSPSGQP